jgi:hypothetical protein
MSEPASNAWSPEWRLVSQPVVVRVNDDWATVWAAGVTMMAPTAALVELPSHEGVLSRPQ